MSTMDEGILREFLAETAEGLAQVEHDLVALERTPANRERIASVFRAFHSIKGTCGFFGFTKLATVAHAGESLLSRLRDGERTFDSDVANALLALVDAVRTILARIEATHEEGDGDFSSLIESLNGLAEAASSPPPAAETFDALLARSEAAVGALAETTIRVDVQLLDLLMNLVGELVLARNQLLLNVAGQDRAVLPGTVQRLNHVTTELQERIMKTRMQPIGNLCNKLPRLVRDVAAACGKQVRLELEGVDTELDRTVLEAIRDPLTHLVRNAIDHGIEPPADRAARGKPAEGRLLVRAFHEGGKVHLHVTDDGGGLPIAAIREHAIGRGVIPAERLAHMTDRDWANLIFQPGFTTADHVSDVSGRGVGMDVVKTNVERIGGAIDVESEHGRGTTVRIRIPLTLAIVPALIVAAGGERYAIPQTSLIELLRVERDEAAARISAAYAAPVLRYRDGLLPLLDLGAVLGCRRHESEGGGGNVPGGPGTAGTVSIAVLHADGYAVGLVVDAIEASQEIVVKPLSEPLRRIPVFAGATILGDGAVALILDVPGLARHAGISRPVASVDDPERTAVTEDAQPEVQTLVVCRAGARWTVAILQEQIARLEEFRRDEIERIGGRAVIQYRGDVLPLVSLGALLDGSGTSGPADGTWDGEGDPVRVVVHECAGRPIGLVVESIVEIVQERVTRREDAAAPGFLGAMVVRGSVTEWIDIDGLLRGADLGRCLAVATSATAFPAVPGTGEAR